MKAPSAFWSKHNVGKVERQLRAVFHAASNRMATALSQPFASAQAVQFTPSTISSCRLKITPVIIVAEAEDGAGE